MNLPQVVYDTLLPIKCIVTHMVRAKDLPSASYRIFDRRPTLHGDGKPIREEAYCWIDIWTINGKSKPISNEIKQHMANAGWRYVREEDGIETEQGIYQLSLIFYLEFSNQDGG